MTENTDTENTRQAAYPDPTEPGFYWRRTMHAGYREEPGWRWTVVEVYRLFGQPANSPLMTNGYEVAGSGVEWGPRCEQPGPKDPIVTGLRAAPVEMIAAVISATRTTAVIKLPSWSDEVVFHARAGSRFWPSPAENDQENGHVRGLPRPAVNTEYRVMVDLTGAWPEILSWRSHREGGMRQETLPAPFDLPTPPDRLPVADGAGLTRLLEKHLGGVTTTQRETVAYLIRRAYGQGCGDTGEEPSFLGRCPSHPKDGARCVRREDHFGAHVDVRGEEWLIAVRCRIDMGVDGFPTCDRIEGHEGACVARPSIPAQPLILPMKRRGVCRCGHARQEHEGPTHTGGCAATNCERYAP